MSSLRIGKEPIRKSFGKIKDIVPVPNLLKFNRDHLMNLRNWIVCLLKGSSSVLKKYLRIFFLSTTMIKCLLNM